MDTLFSQKSHLVEHLSEGPFGPYLPQLDDWVVKQEQDGYKPRTIEQTLRFVKQLGAWMEREGAKIRDLNTDLMTGFLRSEGNWAQRRGSAATGDRLLKHLESEGIIVPRVSPPRLVEPHEIVDGLRDHLLEERGLAPVTLLNILPTVRQFLVECSCTGSSPLTGITAENVTDFVQRQVQHLSVVRSKLMVVALRAFFRYLRQRGEIHVDLAACVPTVVDWGRAGLPKSLEPEHVELLLESCNRESEVGRRDYAILVLMARLGLRACEVV